MDPGSACVTCPKNKPTMENGRKKVDREEGHKTTLLGSAKF